MSVTSYIKSTQRNENINSEFHALTPDIPASKCANTAFTPANKAAPYFVWL